MFWYNVYAIEEKNIMPNPYRDTTKRYRSQGLPVELCVKLEQAVGVAPGQKPSFFQKQLISDIIIKAVMKEVADVELNPANKALVEQEISENRKFRDEASNGAH